MELKGSKTEQNLMTAFAGESQARNKYTFYAQKAREEGMERISLRKQTTTDHSLFWKTGRTTARLFFCPHGHKEKPVLLYGADTSC